jgi:hypothetical protein
MRDEVCRLLGACVLLGVIAARADAVLDWNELALDCIRNDNTGPTTSTRNLAILHTAIYDAVNSVTRTHQPYLLQLNTPEDTSAEAAAVGAAHEIISVLYPSYVPWADGLYDEFVASAPPGAALTNGLELGWWIAAMTLDSRSDDGANTEVPYIPSSLPGQWQRTPPFFRPPLTPHWRYVDTFCLPDLEPFLPAPPPPLDSAEYAAALNEVRALGRAGSTNRTAEQSQIAVFWSDFSYTAMPSGHWSEIAATIARNRTNTLEQNARLFALISLAQADAAIVCWEAKYRYNLWRPITAIQRADEDDNPATEKDAAWNHYLAAPPFPSYTSGHSTFSKATAQVLTHFYGTDAIAFTAKSDSVPGVQRAFTSLAACADEIGMSRIYGGIHFQFDNREGKLSGKRIGDYVSTNFLLPNNDLPQVRMEGFADGMPVVRMHGRIGETCVLEVSSDLKNWQACSTNPAVSGGVLVCDGQAGTQAARFYRVRKQ